VTGNTQAIPWATVKRRSPALAAHAASYRLLPGFPGFRATLRLHTGDRGTVAGRSPTQIEMCLEAPKEDRHWARGELAFLARHHCPASYEDDDGRWQSSWSPTTVTRWAAESASWPTRSAPPTGWQTAASPRSTGA
jgi:hypothetical protein